MVNEEVNCKWVQLHKILQKSGGEEDSKDLDFSQCANDALMHFSKSKYSPKLTLCLSHTIWKTFHPNTGAKPGMLQIREKGYALCKQYNDVVQAIDEFQPTAKRWLRECMGVELGIGLLMVMKRETVENLLAKTKVNLQQALPNLEFPSWFLSRIPFVYTKQSDMLSVTSPTVVVSVLSEVHPLGKEVHTAPCNLVLAHACLLNMDALLHNPPSDELAAKYKDMQDLRKAVALCLSGSWSKEVQQMERLPGQNRRLYKKGATLGNTIEPTYGRIDCGIRSFEENIEPKDLPLLLRYIKSIRNAWELYKNVRDNLPELPSTSATQQEINQTLQALLDKFPFQYHHCQSIGDLERRFVWPEQDQGHLAHKDDPATRSSNSDSSNSDSSNSDSSNSSNSNTSIPS